MTSPSLHYLGGGDLDPEGDHRLCENLWQSIINQHAHIYGPNSAYNFAACNAHGIRMDGRGWNRDSAANGQQGGVDYNPGSRALVSLIGDQDDVITPELQRACADFATEAFGRGFDRPLRGHSDFVATACPGHALYDFIVLFNAGVTPDVPIPTKRRRSSMIMYYLPNDDQWCDVYFANVQIASFKNDGPYNPFGIGPKMQGYLDRGCGGPEILTGGEVNNYTKAGGLRDRLLKK